MEDRSAFAVLICFALLSSTFGGIIVPEISDHSRFLRLVAPSLHVFRGKCIETSSDLADCQRFCIARRFRHSGCNFNRNICICSDKAVDFENYDGEFQVLL